MHTEFLFLDRQIDALGDVLYALTPAELKIVEQNR